MSSTEKRNLRVFGYGLAVIIVFFVLRLAFKHQELTPGKIAALGIAAVLILVTALRLTWLKPLYTVWMKVARFIGEIVNFVLLSVIFYTIFSIPALILKLLGKDLLDQRIEKDVQTYWRTRPQEDFDRERYTKQF